MTPPFSDASYAIAPDGTHSAYTVVTDGVARLWVRSFNFGFAQALAGTEDASNPFWSPDDSRLVFRSDRSGRGDLYVRPADGSAHGGPDGGAACAARGS